MKNYYLIINLYQWVAFLQPIFSMRQTHVDPTLEFG